MSNVVAAQQGDKLYIRKATTGNALEISTDGTNWTALDYDALPAGGTAGQMLTVTAEGLAWVTPESGVTSYNDLTDKPTIPTIPGAATVTTDGLMSAGDKSKLDGMVAGYKGYYATSEALIAAHAAGADGDFASVGATDTIWAWDSDTSAWVNTGAGTITVSWANVSGKPTFSAVATSGSYNDLSDKPTIPAAYTLPAASTTVLGGVKIDGTSITITDGVISAAGGSSFSGVTLASNPGLTGNGTAESPLKLAINTYDFGPVEIGNSNGGMISVGSGSIYMTYTYRQYINIGPGGLTLGYSDKPTSIQGSTVALPASVTFGETSVSNPVGGNIAGLKIAKLTQTEYDALSTKDATTLYVIVG